MAVSKYYEEDGITLYCGDCREVLRDVTVRSDLVLTDPPYPNNAGHFINQMDSAVWVFENYKAEHWLIFWDELIAPPIQLPIVAKHIWYRSNTNRPNNYEAIYEYSITNKRRASRVLSYAVICVGLTGCIEATGHPTQKSNKLIKHLIEISGESGLVFDPFCGSGTTLVAAKQLGRKAVGIEIEEKYCEIAVKRLAQMELFK